MVFVEKSWQQINIRKVTLPVFFISAYYLWLNYIIMFKNMTVNSIIKYKSYLKIVILVRTQYDNF